MKGAQYTEKNGWTGLDDLTLYLITDVRTKSETVRPGYGMRGIGPAVTIRVATRDEAHRLWQFELHKGWKVEES